jgi:hypothetical protein
MKTHKNLDASVMLEFVPTAILHVKRTIVRNYAVEKNFDDCGISTEGDGGDASPSSEFGEEGTLIATWKNRSFTDGLNPFIFASET